MKTIKITFLALAAVFAVSCNNPSNNADVATAEGTDGTTEVATVDGVEKATPVVAEGAENIDPATAPVLTMESDMYDFGDVTANGTTEKVIEFTNTGKTPLIIKSAKGSCGCTVPKYSEEPIAPGEKGSLSVSFKAPANNGKQTKTVTLTTNTAKTTETFKITANVVGGSEKPAPQPMPAPQQPSLPAPSLGQ